MWKKIVFLMFLAGLCFTCFAEEEGKGIGIGIKVGTPGAGIEIGMPFTEKIEGRLGFNYFTYSYDRTEAGIKYDADATLLTIGALIDWHPAGGSFRLTGGVLYNGNEVEGKASGTLEIGNTTYQNASVKASVDFNKLSPYIGIGWNTSFGGKKQWGFICDIGVIYHGSPKVSLTATGTGITADDVKREEEDLKDAIEDYVWYPVITFGLIYKF